MNVKYTIFLWFIMSYLLIEIGAIDLTEEEQKLFKNEEEAIELCYNLTIQCFDIHEDEITTNEYLFILGDRNLVKILDCLKELEALPDLTSRQVFGEILRGVFEKNGTNVLNFLNKINRKLIFFIGEKIK